MAELTQAESNLFSLFYGETDLIDNNAFWAMACNMLIPEDNGIALPIPYNPMTVRRLLSSLKCSPGECGQCCRKYTRVAINEFDIKRIQENTEFKDISGLVQQDDKGKYLKGNPCPFLKDNVCQIHDYRPDTCYMFPIMGTKVVKDTLTGKEVQVMTFRKTCVPAMKVIREILNESIQNSQIEMMLLPDLSITTKKVTHG